MTNRYRSYEAFGVAVRRSDGSVPKFSKMAGMEGTDGSVIFMTVEDAQKKADALNQEYDGIWGIFRLLIDVIEEVK